MAGLRRHRRRSRTEEPPADDLLTPSEEPSAEPLFPEDQTFEIQPQG